MTREPFHAGEQALQTSVGLRERMAEVGAVVIRDHMPDQHRELFERLPTLIVGALDRGGQPWATLLHGPQGFLRTPDAQTIRVAAIPDPADPARAGLVLGRPVGLLGLEPHTRRRNRANGEIVEVGSDSWSVRVRQSYGNCPKYIHRRQPSPAARTPAAPLPEGPRLSALAHRMITQADTMFIASSSDRTPGSGEGEGVDVSHRGGPEGFVAVERGEADVLTIADYSGNMMFNTLGNLLVWPRAGLLFVDWREGHVLQLAASAQVQAEGPERVLRVTVRGGWLRTHALALSWSPSLD